MGKDRILYISDLHLFHPRMIEKCKRPFSNEREMNDFIIQKWREKVKRGDTVYILGDIGMYHAEDIGHIMNSLPGRKILITGNHDVKNLKNHVFRSAFYDVCPYREINDNGRHVVLFHYPIEEWDGYFRGFYHLHGHVHNQDQQIRKIDRRYNVSADTIGFVPMSLDELDSMK